MGKTKIFKLPNIPTHIFVLLFAPLFMERLIRGVNTAPPLQSYCSD